MVLTQAGKLWSFAVKSLRVLSEDASSSHQTRGALCSQGAIKALGTALKDLIEKNSDFLHCTSILSLAPPASFNELYEALCGFANLLSSSSLGPQSNGVSEEELVERCLEAVNSGGLESLIVITFLLSAPHDESNSQHFQRMSFLEESLRSLVAVAPLLLEKELASEGCFMWTDTVLKALYCVNEIDDSAIGVQLNVLRTLHALATSEPLAIQIVDRFLPHLLQASIAEESADVPSMAKQVILSLDFSANTEAVQIARNDPQLLADLFCLQCSFMIQAMAREEIKQYVESIWDDPLQEVMESSKLQSSINGSSMGSQLFDGFPSDSHVQHQKECLLNQYYNTYGAANIKLSRLLTRVLTEREELDQYSGLLAQQVFPLNSSIEEREWILNHSH